MLECALCRKAQRSCWRWTPMGRILSRLPHTTWSRIRTRRPLPVRSKLSIDARSCAKPVQKKTKALARRLGTPVLECFLAFYRLVVIFTPRKIPESLYRLPQVQTVIVEVDLLALFRVILHHHICPVPE